MRCFREKRRTLPHGGTEETIDEAHNDPACDNSAVHHSCCCSDFPGALHLQLYGGSLPNGDLIRDSAGNLYGTTQFGGALNQGIIYKLDSSGQETVLYSFNGSTDGGIPIGRLVGSYYGVTFYGGTTNSTCTVGCGVVYRVNDSGKYAVLYRFTGASDGWLPTGGLTSEGAGNLYGTALLGGTETG